MKPIHLSAENVKGRDFQYDLAPVNAFTGANDVGKTSILDAAKLALLGYHPDLGKQNQQTVILMSDDRLEMNVSMTFENGQSNRRTWTRTPKGEIKKTEDCDFNDIPPVMFDLRLYLGLTKKERIKMIFDRIDPTKLQFDPGLLLSRLMTIELLPVEQCKAALVELAKFYEKSLKRKNASKQSVQDWLATFQKELDTESKRYKILFEQSSAAMTAQRQDILPKSVAGDLCVQEKIVDDLARKISELQTLSEIATSTAQRKTYLEQVVTKPLPDMEEKKNFATSLRAELQQPRPDRIAIQNEFQLKREEVETKRKELTKLENDILETKSRLAALAGQHQCPYCGTKGEDWKVKLKAELEAKLKEQEQEYGGRVAVYDSLIAQKHVLRVREEEALKAEQDAMVKQQRLILLDKEIISSGKEVLARENARAELAGLGASVPTVDPAAIPPLQTLLAEAKQKLTDLQTTEAGIKQAHANRTKLLTLEKELLTNQTLVEVYKQAASLVLEEQEKIADKAFTTIIATARKFTDGLIPGSLDYRDGDFGMIAGNWVPHEVMATASRVLTYIGIAIALAQDSPCKLVIIDEAGIIDPERKKLVLARLMKLCDEGVIDCVFMADPSAQSYEAFVKDPRLQLVKL